MRKKSLLLFLVCLVAISVGGGIMAQEPEEHSEGEHEQTIWQTLGQWTNFFVLIAILYWFLNKKLRVQDKFKAQADEIQLSIASAREAKEEAERQLQVMEQRMEQMNEEVVKIRERALRDAEDEKKRILDSAQKEAQRIVQMAHREIENEVRVAKKRLRKQVADIAVEQGRRIIEREINEEDQQRLIKTYIEEFGK